MKAAHEAFDSQVSKALSTAEANAGTLGEKLEARMNAAIATAESGFARLTEQAETQRAAAEQAGQRAIALQQDAVAGAGVAGTALVEGFTEARRHIADFVAERLRQDIEIQGELLSCRTLDDVRRNPVALLPQRHRPVFHRGEPDDEARHRRRRPQRTEDRQGEVTDGPGRRPPPRRTPSRGPPTPTARPGCKTPGPLPLCGPFRPGAAEPRPCRRRLSPPP